MRTIPKEILLIIACKQIKYAASIGIWNGKDNSMYFESCRWLLERYPATIVFTKESGYHTGGWWKNPEYERCWHLSISFRCGSEVKVCRKIIDFLFMPYERLIWVEPPYSEEGKKLNVWHYRLFCDENWQPIKPKGEVYNTQFTEIGWKSFTELQYEK